MIWIQFYPPGNNLGVLKQVGIISISRYIQLVGCLCYGFYIHKILVEHISSFNEKFLQIIDNLMFFFMLFWISMFILRLIGVENPFVYGNNRLRGGYIEGGPFGLFIATYYAYRMVKFKFSIVWTLLTIILLLASQSKASFLFILILFCFYLALYNKITAKTLIFSVLIGISCVALASRYFNFTDNLFAYYADYKDIKYEIEERGDDPSLVMGRISGSYIMPEMIKDNPLLGIGLGNYSLVRNNPNYRKFLPAVKAWDLPGMGGIIIILLETGIVGLILFLSPFYKIWQSSKFKTIKFVLIVFVLTQMFGVQTYFQYLWFLVGLMTAMYERPNSVRIVGPFR
jgi:O-antigen ligase